MFIIRGFPVWHKLTLVCYTESNMLVAVDTGGTKTLVAVFDTDGSVVDSVKFPTPLDTHLFIRELDAVIDSLINKNELDAIAIALPGRIRDGVMLSAGNLKWKHFDIAARLKDHFGVKILVENDANLAGLAETRALSKIPARSLYITVSTGIGTGSITHGAIDEDLSESEGGQIMLEHNGVLLEWEKFASGQAIHKKYGKYAYQITSKRAWYDIAKDINKGIVCLAPTLRPDIIIIGGSIGTHFAHYGDTLNALAKEYLHYGNVPHIVQAKHPEEAVIYGCYYYAVDRLAD